MPAARPASRGRLGGAPSLHGRHRLPRARRPARRQPHARHAGAPRRPQARHGRRLRDAPAQAPRGRRPPRRRLGVPRQSRQAAAPAGDRDRVPRRWPARAGVGAGRARRGDRRLRGRQQGRAARALLAGGREGRRLAAHARRGDTSGRPRAAAALHHQLRGRPREVPDRLRHERGALGRRPHGGPPLHPRAHRADSREGRGMGHGRARGGNRHLPPGHRGRSYAARHAHRALSRPTGGRRRRARHQGGA